jgi:thymidylate synthase (FAD)
MKTNLQVSIIAHTPEPEKILAAAAKLCYSKAGTDEIMENLDKDSIEKFLNTIISMGHMSPIEHVSFTFAVQGVSRTLTHQLVRHRVASYSQKSQRYVREGQFEYIIPPEIEKENKAAEIFLKSMQDAQKAYDEIADILKAKYENELITQGKSEKAAKSTAEKKAIEDARYVLPNACETKIVFTMNARELLHFTRLRSCERAQWEIRQLAEEMIKQLKVIAPTVFKYAGPPCLTGPCPEGKMSCGKMSEKRKLFNID